MKEIVSKMLVFGAIMSALLLLGTGSAFAQSANSPNAVWNGSWAPRSAADRQADLNAAQLELQAESGGLVTLSVQNYSGQVTNNYTYTGSVSSSASSNAGAVNSVSTSITGVTNGTVSLTVLPSTSVAGASQNSGSTSQQSPQSTSSTTPHS